MGQKEPRQSPDKTEPIQLHVGSQLAIMALSERNRRARFKRKMAGLFFCLVLILLTPPTLCTFYCGNIIGSTFEASLLHTYPRATAQIIGSALIMDGWYLKIFAPLFEGFRGTQGRKLREAVIALGREETGEGDHDPEKIRTLREEVGVSLRANPEAAKRILTFTVYEHPSAKKTAALPPE